MIISRTLLDYGKIVSCFISFLSNIPDLYKKNNIFSKLKVFNLNFKCNVFFLNISRTSLILTRMILKTMQAQVRILYIILGISDTAKLDGRHPTLKSKASGEGSFQWNQILLVRGLNEPTSQGKHLLWFEFETKGIYHVQLPKERYA